MTGEDYPQEEFPQETQDVETKRCLLLQHNNPICLWAGSGSRKRRGFKEETRELTEAVSVRALRTGESLAETRTTPESRESYTCPETPLKGGYGLEETTESKAR